MLACDGGYESPFLESHFRKNDTYSVRSKKICQGLRCFVQFWKAFSEKMAHVLWEEKKMSCQGINCFMSHSSLVLKKIIPSWKIFFIRCFLHLWNLTSVISSRPIAVELKVTTGGPPVTRLLYSSITEKQTFSLKKNQINAQFVIYCLSETNSSGPP